MSRRFETTRWSLVAAARDGDAETARVALSALCERYWYPLYAFVRRTGHAPADAEDLTQGFLAQLLERRGFEQARADRGRLRSFLLRSLRNFLMNEADARHAAKRGGGAITVPIELEAGEARFAREPAAPDTPETIFDRTWARAVLDGVLDRLRDEARAAGRADEFAVLRHALTGDADRGAYQAWARELGTTEGAVKVAVHRLRRQFRERVRDAIADTLTDPDDPAVDDELAFLSGILRH
jgi:RNA polymerase sigma-70 factor (ECF subfamily)